MRFGGESEDQARSAQNTPKERQMKWIIIFRHFCKEGLTEAWEHF